MQTAHLAIDLGASSGRAVLGLLGGEPLRLETREVHRFEHLATDTPAGPVWDFTGILREVYSGIRAGVAAAKETGVELSSVGVDTWGVDWGLVSPAGGLLGLPRCYRDPLNAQAKDWVLDRVEGGPAGLFARNGIQPMPFNTLFQLYGRAETAADTLVGEGRLQLTPDLIHYHLTGKLSNERTIASTGALLDADTRDWDRELLESLGIPTSILGPLSDAGTRLGPLRPELAAELGAPESLEVVLPASHDTASAVAAVPAAGRAPGTWCYLSSGTWSLLGMELETPLTTAEALNEGFTNELGAPRNGQPTVRFLRNIGGLWLIQELRRDLAKHGTDVDFAELALLAEEAPGFKTVIDPNADDLAAPGDSIAKLKGHAKRTGQAIPETPGQLARCCLESLALCYAETVDRLEKISGGKIEVLHAVGGGINNRLLNQLTAAAIARPVVTGPVEGTSIGNLLTQAMGLGRFDGLDALREIVARSFPVEVIEESGDSTSWGEARSRYQQVTK